MGAVQSNKQQKEISEFIQWQDLCKKLDRHALGRIFSDEFRRVCELWNAGSLKGKHFNRCTFLVERLQNEELQDRYVYLLTQWNAGKILKDDFEYIIELLTGDNANNGANTVANTVAYA